MNYLFKSIMVFVVLVLVWSLGYSLGYKVSESRFTKATTNLANCYENEHGYKIWWMADILMPSEKEHFGLMVDIYYDDPTMKPCDPEVSRMQVKPPEYEFR